MTKKIKTLFSRINGQAMTEFGMALPILLTVIFGLLEVGRAVFMYAAVTNASREAVRFATAYGVNESNVLNYQNCAGIRNTAKRVGFLLPIEDDNIKITYDAGPDDSGIIQPLSGTPECASDETVDNTIELNCGDRVVVTVSLDYHPILPILPIKDQEFKSSSARTYLGIIELVDDAAACN